jgi:hypothetical protein
LAESSNAVEPARACVTSELVEASTDGDTITPESNATPLITLIILIFIIFNFKMVLKRYKFQRSKPHFFQRAKDRRKAIQVKRKFYYFSSPGRQTSFLPLFLSRVH